MQSSLVFLLLAVVATLAQSQVNRPGDCYAIGEPDGCVSTNNMRPMNSTNVHCLWCHSHGTGGKSKSHCAAHKHVKTNVAYHTDWVCDYRLPTVAHHLGGKFNRTVRPVRNNHGRRLLDDAGANQITQFIENEVANWPPAAQVLAGVVYGSLGSLPNDLNSCLGDAEHLYTDLETTFNNWQWTWSLDVILPELQEVFEDIEDVVDTVKACESAFNDVKSDISKVLSIIKGSTGPIGWLVEAGEIAWNSENIYQDISGAITNFQSDQYFEAGYNIGAIIYILV
jgi:hypothetical protein